MNKREEILTLTEAGVGTTAFRRRAFRRRADYFRLTHLCGLPVIGRDDDNGPPSAQGMALLQVDGQRYEGDDLTLEAVQKTEHTIVCQWLIGDRNLYLTTTWEACPDTGIVSRQDTLVNAGDRPVTVSRCLARIVFPSGEYECYTQASRWCHENQGNWQPLHTGLHLQHASGRTTQGATPYLALRATGTDNAIAFHILPRGNWTLKVSPITEGGALPLASVELGLADENLNRHLPPGDSMDLPEILCQPLPLGKPHLGAPLLHRYLLTHHFAEAKPQAPVVYNTWFYEFEILDVPRLRRQLATAAEIGCEVFAIDAGWYGAGGPNWAAQTGDWREKTTAAFHGNMQAFANEVRAAGLGFGLWMEPERFGPEAPIRAEHPEWFIPVGEMARIDLTQRVARDWLRAEIGRLVETYDLAWMKVDFNLTLDADVSGAELYDYTAAWYHLIDDIRETYPTTFFEGCSSGAMRGDLATLSHFDGHFLSDSVNPVDMLRISQGAFLRLLPGRITRWTVVRPAGQAVPRYRQSVEDSPQTILTPCGALWEPAESVDLDFAMLAGMPGMLGFSGDLANLAPRYRTRIAEAVAFYKAWRRFITGAVAHLLTPPESLASRNGWVALQLQGTDNTSSLLFVYRLGVCPATQNWRLRGLDPQASYAVQRALDADAEVVTISGDELMSAGLECELPAEGISGTCIATLYKISPLHSQDNTP